MCKGRHTHTHTHTQARSHSHCDSHNHAGENVSLFVKQKSLTESISRQGEWRILDSIKLTAFPIGTPLTGPLFNQTSLCVRVCVCVHFHRCMLHRVSVCIYLEDELIFLHPPRGQLALLGIWTHTNTQSQNLIRPSAVTTKPYAQAHTLTHFYIYLSEDIHSHNAIPSPLP